MTLEQDSDNRAPQAADVVAGTGNVHNNGDNLGEFRLPAKDEKPSAAESVLTAGGTGALVSLASPRYGPAMREWADAAFTRQTESFPLTKFGDRLDDSFRFLKPSFLQEAQETQGLLNKADWQIARGLLGTASNGNWVPEASMAKAAFNGAAVAGLDWMAGKGLESVTGIDALRPNLIESALVTGAAISPIPGNYKIAAIALAVGIGKLPNIIG